jgi:hypothetical protein
VKLCFVDDMMSVLWKTCWIALNVLPWAKIYTMPSSPQGAKGWYVVPLVIQISCHGDPKKMGHPMNGWPWHQLLRRYSHTQLRIHTRLIFKVMVPNEGMYHWLTYGLRNHPMLPSSELKMSKTNKNINISSNYK